MIKDKEEIYKAAQMGCTSGFGKKCAVLVVDFQKRFTHQNKYGSGGDMSKECKAARVLIDCARKKNMRIFYSYMGFRPDGVDIGAWSRKGKTLATCIAGQGDESEIDEHLEVRDEDIVFIKTRPSVFFATNLVEMLISLHVDTVIICGCTVAGCLYASVVDCISYGFRTIVCEEASADRSPETREMFLWNINQKYADVMSLEDICKAIDQMDVQTDD